MTARSTIIKLLCFALAFNLGFGQNNTVLMLSTTDQHVTVKKPFLFQFADPFYTHSLSTIRQLPANQWVSVNSVNFGSKGGAGWVTFQLQTTFYQTVWLELQSHFIDSVQVWLIQNPGLPNESIRMYRSTGFGSLIGDQDAPTQHPYFLKPLHLLPTSGYAIYIRGWVPPADVLKFEVNVWHPSSFWQHQQRLIAGWAVFVGLVLMSVFITLVSYAFHPRRIYLYYCGYILCMSGYALLNDGWGMFLPDSLNWFDRTSTAVHWLSFGILFFMLFTRRFLVINAKRDVWWLRINPLCLGLLVEAAILVVSYGIDNNRFEWVQAGYQVGFGVLALYALLWISYIVDAIRRRFRPVWLYIGSVVVWLFFYVTNIFVVNTGWITDSFPDMLVFRGALLTEVAILFIGWMYRQRIIRQSEQLLQAQEQIRQQKLLEAERDRQAEELKVLRLQNELQQQRERLARDLHDGIGSQLTHIAGRLDILSFRKTEEQSQLQRLSHFTRETNQALRDTVWILNRSEIQLSTFTQRLHAYLLRLWEDIDQARLDWFPYSPTQDSTDLVLPPLVAQSLFRITQEAVNNALKYAKATTISVCLNHKDNHINLSIADNGLGFNTANVIRGYGLINMQKRAEEINGQWILTSSNGGTKIQVNIPVSY